MTDGDALLNAILANPDDVLVRLVYADWLDENGEPERAEFIRLQLGRDEPPSMKWEDFLGRERERELEGKVRGRDRDRLSEGGDGWLDWTYRAGFIHGVRYTGDRWLAVASDLFASAPIRTAIVWLPDTPLGIDDDWDAREAGQAAVVARLVADPHLGRLSDFTLEARRLGTPAVSALLESPHLDGVRLQVRRWMSDRLSIEDADRRRLRDRWPAIHIDAENIPEIHGAPATGDWDGAPW